MQRWTVVFYFKGLPSYKGTFEVLADTLPMAGKVVQSMIDIKAPEIPQNFDDYEIYDFD